MCEQLKQDSRYRDIPIIFLSAMDSTNDMVTGFKMGGADYITKPFIPAILLARVDTHLDLFLSRKREQQTRDRLEDILRSMNEGLAVVNPEGVIEQVNPKLETLIGISATTLLGSAFDALFVGEEHGEEETAARTLQHQSGEQIPVHILSASLSEAPQGGSQVLLLHDMRALLSAESMRQASEAKDAFLASMSHELRTPLASIIGNSELLVERLEEASLQQLARQIEVAGREQLAKIRDVLEVSRIENGTVVVEESPFDLSALIDELKYRYTLLAEQAGLVLQVVEQDLPPQSLLGDAQHLQQILQNLLSNALKFTEKGAISLSIWCSEEQIHFKVQDSGIGISEVQLERLFERFQQVDSSISRQFGGSGLGLSGPVDGGLYRGAERRGTWGYFPTQPSL